MDQISDIGGDREPVTGRRENHLMDAAATDAGWIRAVMSGLPQAAGITTPAGHVAITRADAVAAGLDTLAVSRWLQPLGGFGCVTYLRPPSHKYGQGTCRPALHPVSYFSVPVTALSEAEPQASADAGAGPSAAVA
jgi:hypothetical protein